MKTYTIYGTNDHKRFIEKTWTPVGTVRAKNKAEALVLFKQAWHRDNPAVQFLTDEPQCFAYRVKIEH